MRRFLLALALALLGSPAVAAPRDDLLRVAPADAAIIVLVQNAHGHIQNLDRSPFAKWFPESALGKQLLGGVDFRHARESVGPLFAALEVTPEALIADIFGDAVAFAYTPSPTDDAKGERAVVLIRPRKPETLAKLIAKLNAIQSASGEVKAVVPRKHDGEEYFERQKPSGGGSDFYCFRDGVFAFSGTEPDIKSVIDRDKAGAGKPELAAKLAKLGVADAFLVALVNPRPFDAEVKAKVAKANPNEKPLLTRFQELWLALDSAAIYIAFDANLEAGVSLQFQPGKLPPLAKGWLTGPRQEAPIWQAIPDTALFAIAGRIKPTELIEVIGAVAPGDGKNPLRVAAEQFLGPVFGKDKLAAVLAAVGPNWAVWAEPPPTNGGFLPVVVAAVQLDDAGPKGKQTVREIVGAVEFGFRTARIAYNASHADQIELEETLNGDVRILSLVNEKAFPPGFHPSFAFKGGYLLLATSPDALARFREPKGDVTNTGEARIARISGSAARDYLLKHREPLAKFLAAAGQGDEKELLKHLDQFAAVLELVDRIDLTTRGDETGLRIALRVKLAKALK